MENQRLMGSQNLVVMEVCSLKADEMILEDCLMSATAYAS